MEHPPNAPFATAYYMIGIDFGNRTYTMCLNQNGGSRLCSMFFFIYSTRTDIVVATDTYVVTAANNATKTRNTDKHLTNTYNPLCAK